MRREPLLRLFYRHFGRPHLPTRADRLLRSVLGVKRDTLSLPRWINPDLARRADLEGRDRSFSSRWAAGRSARQEIYTHLVAIPGYWRISNWHDRSAAIYGIEVRHPFLDRRLFEYVLSIPGEQLFRLGRSKDLLRRSMTGILPESIRLRNRKTSFAPFLDFLFRGRAASEIRELLRAPVAADMGFLDGESLRTAALEYLDGGNAELRRDLWYAITSEIWLRRCEASRNQRQKVLAARSAA
jgi:asparagine synthase (glutamine-hydrolysing)